MSMMLMVQALKAKVGSPLRKLVLVKLADQANDDGECWPSYQTVADACEMGRSTVRAHIAWLEEHGFLRIEYRHYGNGGKSKTNVYHLTIEKGSEAERNSQGQDSNGSNPDRLDSDRLDSDRLDSDRGVLKSDPFNGSNSDPEPINQPINEPLPPSGVSARATAAPSSEIPDPPPEPPPPAKPKRKQPLPDDFAVTDAMRAWFAEQGFGFALQGEHERFCDYWRGRGEPMKDWEAVWRNWMRKAADFAKPKPQAQRPSGHDLSRMDYGETRIPKDVDWLQGV